MSFHLARVLAAKGSNVESNVLYAAVLEWQERNIGPKAVEVATTLEHYAELMHSTKSVAQAREMEFRAKQIRAERAYTVTVR